MKKKHPNPIPASISGIKKILLTMKLALIIAFLCVLQANANVYSQITVNLDVQDQSISAVLKTIEQQSQIRFFYNDDLLAMKELIDVKAVNENIIGVLDDIFAKSPLTYKTYDNNLIVIAPRQILQQQKVTGTIKDASTGEPIVGANIVIKGTTIGALTDINGNYSIAISDQNEVLVISFIGYKSDEIPVLGKNIIDGNLAPDVQALEEVVVIGYGTQKKSDLTGSVIRVNMDQKSSVANISLSSALKGVTAGVNVGGEGTAGSEPDLSIRGKTSLSASDAPLIVLDGIIYNGSISDINVNDVESIDILKDASAAAVYGSRSANGVMIITTKKGKSEKPLFNVNAYYGFQDYTNSPERVMNGDEFAVRLVDFYYQQSLYSWYATKPTSDIGKPVRGDVTDRNYVSSFIRTQEEKDNYLAGKYVDWMKEIKQSAPIMNYDVSVSGKTEKTNYYISGSYTDQKGCLVNDDYSRATVHTTLENKINDWITMGINTTYTYRDYSGIEASMSNAMIASPLVNVTNSLGTYSMELAKETQHPLQYTICNNIDYRKNLFMLGYVKIQIPKIKGLTYDFNYSNTSYDTRNATFYPSTTTTGNANKGYAIKNYDGNTSWIINNIINYSRVFGGYHSIAGTLLYSRESRTGESSQLTASGFNNETLGYNSMELGGTQTVNTAAWEENSLSYMARINYSYKSRYLFTGTVRRDGFSGFGANKKIASFPSLSIGWVISDENFLKSLKTISFLKLRTSAGKNGNQGIGRYSSFSGMSTASYVYGTTTSIGLYPNSLGNADLGWESTLSYNVGIDFGLFKDRISGSIDMYKSMTSNVLVSRTIPGATGYQSVWTNLGGINNKGIELSLNTININKKDFRWETKFVFSLNRDKITKLYGGKEDKDIGNSWFVGKPIDAIYDYKSDYSVWTEKEFYNGDIKVSGVYPGQYKIQDLNGDNELDADHDRTIVGYESPSYRFSITNNVTYKNFTLSIFINSIQGGNGYYKSDNARAILSCITYAGGDAGIQYVYRNNLVATRQYWTPDNGVTNAPGLYYLPKRLMGLYQDRSFVRLQDVSLTYTFPNRTLSKLNVSGLQIYMSGKNLYTWTNWEGWDPEMTDSYTRIMRNVITGIRLTF